MAGYNNIRIMNLNAMAEPFRSLTVAAYTNVVRSKRKYLYTFSILGSFRNG